MNRLQMALIFLLCLVGNHAQATTSQAGKAGAGFKEPRYLISNCVGRQGVKVEGWAVVVPAHTTCRHNARPTSSVEKAARRNVGQGAG